MDETDLVGILKVLVNSKRACARLQHAVEPELGAAAVTMLRRGELEGSIGDRIHDLFYEKFHCDNGEVKEVWLGTTYDPYDEDNPETNFRVTIREYCGVFVVQTVEYDDVYFLSKKAALSYIMNNGVAVRKGR